MSNDKDYRNKIEEHRQEVEMDDVATRRTRSRRTNKQKNGPRIPLISVLVFVFILIPLSFLAYFGLIYKPEQAAPNIDNEDDTVVQFEKNEPVSSGATDLDKEEEDESTNNGQENDSDPVETDIEVSAEEKAAIAKQAEEAARKLKEEEEKKKAEEKRKNEAVQVNKTDKVSTHVVQSSSDTLYSIAIKYYKDPKMVDKIKQANNLKSDSIFLGQTLILP